MIDQVQQAISILQGIQSTPAQGGYKVGIGITTYNRPDVFSNTYAQIKRFAPANAVIAVVDDSSPQPVAEASYRFAKNVGIAQAKNKCLELLYRAGCDHFFLFDDDCYPVKEGWETHYIQSREPHLNYIFKDFATGSKLNDTTEIFRDDNIIAYSHVRGCMIYCNRTVLEKVGGMDPVYGKWGWEHPSWSDRIFMAGLTSFRYMDVVGSSDYIYSMDEHRKVSTTVGGKERNEQIAKNKPIYNQQRFSAKYVPFFFCENILLTCYLTGAPDPQKGKKWAPNKEELRPLIDSLKQTRLVVLTDCLPPGREGNVEYVRVSANINPYFNRWVLYRQYLQDNRHQIANAFCIDATDVEILNEPDWAEMGEILYVGDEDEKVGCEWIKKHHVSPMLNSFYAAYAQRQLLNAGLIGGSVDILLEFMRQLIDCYSLSKEAEFTSKTPAGDYTDMAMFNYILYSNFRGRFQHGRQINTKFKGNERNEYSWFKHK